MSLVKDIYLDEVLKRTDALVEQGMSPDEAYEIASDDAFYALGDRLADMADQARDQWKERDL